MKVIFLEDMPNVAKAGEIKEVSDGYGRNFLIPRKLAILAKPGAMKTVEKQIEIIARKKAREEDDMRALATLFEGKEITIQARAGANERLYGSITAADIAAEIEKLVGVAIDKRKVELGEPIHKLGGYEVVVRLGKDIVPKIKVTVAEKTEKTEQSA